MRLTRLQFTNPDDYSHYVRTAYRVRTVRLRQPGRSQASVARAIGVTPSLLNGVELGDTRPTHRLLTRLAAQFGVPLGALSPMEPRDAAPTSRAPRRRHGALSPDEAEIDSATRYYYREAHSQGQQPPRAQEVLRSTLDSPEWEVRPRANRPIRDVAGAQPATTATSTKSPGGLLVEAPVVRALLGCVQGRIRQSAPLDGRVAGMLVRSLDAGRPLARTSTELEEDLQAAFQPVVVVPAGHPVASEGTRWWHLVRRTVGNRLAADVAIWGAREFARTRAPDHAERIVTLLEILGSDDE